MTLALFLLACAGGDAGNAANTDSTASDSGGDTDTDTRSDTDTAPDGDCATVNAGDDWAWSGECPRMATPVVITVDGCELALDYDSVGGMTMGMPYSATIDGDTVTFADDNSVSGCVGTVDTADKISGTCDRGCEFKLRR